MADRIPGCLYLHVLLVDVTPEVGKLSMTLETSGCLYLHELLVDVMHEVGGLSMIAGRTCGCIYLLCCCLI